MADPTEPAPVNLLQRREIEARIVAPLVRAVAEELGEEKTLEILRKVTTGLAREAGAEMAVEFGEASLEAFSRGIERWKGGGALEIEPIALTQDRLDFNVVRCRYAEMYRRLGLADLGGSMSCCRDFSLIEGFNPRIKLTRTQTLMEGATHCDFRFRAESDSSRSDETASHSGGNHEADPGEQAP